MTKEEKRKILKYIIAIVLFSVFLTVWGSRLDTKPILVLVKKAGIFAPLVYVALLSIPSIIAPLSGSPILIAGYILFEEKIIFFSYLATLIPAIINFYIAKKWGRPLVTKIIGKDDMEKVDKFVQGYGLGSLVFLRVFVGYLHDFISYAYGLTKMKFLPFIIVSAIAPIPWLFIWYFYIFPRVNNVTDFSIWFLVTLIPFPIISWFYWKFINRQK